MSVHDHEVRTSISKARLQDRRSVRTPASLLRVWIPLSLCSGIRVSLLDAKLVGDHKVAPLAHVYAKRVFSGTVKAVSCAARTDLVAH